VSPEVVLAAGYAVFLLGAAVGIEWLSAHTHRRSLRYRTAGFTYHEQHDHWECPEGQQLWPHEFDQERRLVRYRAKAHICNGCPRKEACTDSDRGREIVRPLDPWPHSEAGRFHRALSLVLVVLALVVIVLGGVRNHDAAEAGVLLALLAVALGIGRWLLRDFRAHPSGFPEPTAAHGLGIAVTDAGGRRARSRRASLNRTGGST
jgi:Transposase DDE domain